MSDKKKDSNKGKGGDKKSSAPKIGESASKKGERTRKPPVERAQKLATLVIKKLGALTKLVGRWHGEATPEQSSACARVAAQLGTMAPAADTVAADLGFLATSGFKPAASTGGRRGKVIEPGQKVRIKDDRFDSEVHGDVNAFTVVKVTERNVVLETMDKEGTIPVPRAWIVSPATAPTTAEADSKGNAAA